MANSIKFSSENLNKLNIVKFLYLDGNKVGALFNDESNPLYLVDDTLPTVMMNEVAGDSPLWGAGNQIFGKGIASIMQMASASEAVQNALGSNCAGWSGVVDYRSKLLYAGAQAQSFTIKCMLLNRKGWDVSIAPQLNALADWVLPRRIKDDSGEDYKVGTTAAEAIGKAYEDTLKSKLSAEGTSLVGLVERGLNFVKDWVGDTYLLRTPEQYNDINQQKDMKLVIGRYSMPGVYISGVSVTIPKSFMINSDGVTEPDSVSISLDIKTLRQSSTSNIKF